MPHFFKKINLFGFTAWVQEYTILPQIKDTQIKPCWATSASGLSTVSIKKLIIGELIIVKVK